MAIQVADTLRTLRVERLHRASKTKVQPPRTLKRAEWPPNYDDVLVWRQAQLARYETDPVFLENAKAFYASGVEGCIAFINHWCDTHDPRNAGTSKPVWMPFILFERQEDFVRFIMECIETEQPGLVEKCRTMGATWCAVAVSVWLWLFHPGVAIGWGSQDGVSVDRIGDPKSIFFKIRELIKRLPPCFKPVIGEHDLKQYVCHNSANGASIVGEVGDNIGRGGRTRVYFKDESAHYEHPELIEASVSETTRVPIDISSVNGLGNLFHRKRESGLDWSRGANLSPGYTRVFVMDYADHPEYTKGWFNEKRATHERQGTLHLFAQEIERNYAASVQGTIIQQEWLDACVDADLRLGIERGGPKMSALDLGDSEDGDRNAQVMREGILLSYAEEWYARDPGVTARKALSTCVERGCNRLQYDAGGGLGSNVKSEVNRLIEDKSMPKGLKVVPWNPGGKVLRAADRVVPDDKNSPRNKDFFTNLKAQGWWMLRTRIYFTYQLINRLDNGATLGELGEFDPDDLFALDSKLPLLQKIKKELCQATASKNSKLKLLVDKSPEGTKSPNIADGIVMAYWPQTETTGEFTDVSFAMPKFVVGGEAFR